MTMRLRPVAIALVFAAALAGTATRGGEPLPDSRLGLRTAPLLLLSRPDVRADLGLDDRQNSEADRMIDDLYVQATALRGKSGEAAVAGRKRIDAAQERWLESRLTERQYSRLLQIDLQWEGPSALVSRPKVTAGVGLTAQQVATLKEAVARRDRERTPGVHNPFAEARLARTALAVLTKPQQEIWRNMLGRPFRPQLAQAPAGRATR
jgi:hypothetical protein